MLPTAPPIDPVVAPTRPLPQPGTPPLAGTFAPPGAGVAFLLPNSLELGGVTTWALQLARTLNAQGRPACIVEHELAPQLEAGHRTDWTVPSGVRHQRVPIAPWSPTGSELASIADAYACALPAVLVPGYSAGAYAACARLSRAHADRLRVVGFAHSDTDYFYDQLAYHEPIVHRFVAVSETIAGTLRSRLPASRHPDVVVRPYGIVPPSTAARSYSSPGEPLRLVYAGRLIETQKRVSRLPELAAALVGLGVDFELVVAGSGPDEALLRSLVEACAPDVQRRIRLIGRVSYAEMAALWARADVCVLVSDYEGISISMLEGMCNGAVPVVPRISGTPMVVRDGETGLRAAPGHVAGLAAAVVRLDQDRDALSRMGRAAQREVAGRCDYDAYVRWFADVTDGAWEDAPRRWPRHRPLLPTPPPQAVWNEPRPNLLRRPRWLAKRVLVQHPFFYNAVRRAYRAGRSLLDA